MTVAEVPPTSAVSFDKRKGNVNRMTVAEVPPTSAVSFDKRKGNKTLKHNQPGDGGDASGQ